MHLEVNTVRSSGRTYRYVRLVRAYRKDGKPAKKVVANLGELSDQMIASLRVALQAGREGKAVVLTEPARDEPGVAHATTAGPVTLGPDELRALADRLDVLTAAAAGSTLSFSLAAMLEGGSVAPSADATQQVNTLLTEIANGLNLRT